MATVTGEESIQEEFEHLKTPLDIRREWAKSIEAEFTNRANQDTENENSEGSTQSGPFHIFRVPEGWKDSHTGIFDPDFLSLGLFSSSNLHPGDTKKPSTQFKRVIFKGLINHINSTKQGKALGWRALCDKLVPDPEAMKQYYALDEPQLTSDDTVLRTVFALDSVVLCGYLCAYLLRKSYPKGLYDDIVSKRNRFFHQTLMNDIVKLENQIPLVLIERMLEVIHGSNSVAKGQLVRLCREWVLCHRDSLPGFDRIGPDFKSPLEGDPQHLLGCLCNVMGPGSEAEVSKKIISLPCASKLRERGVVFRRMTGRPGRFVPTFKRGRLRFVSGVLSIPSFSILQNTELVWRNMLAYLLHCNVTERERQSIKSGFPLVYLQQRQESGLRHLLQEVASQPQQRDDAPSVLQQDDLFRKQLHEVSERQKALQLLHEVGKEITRSGDFSKSSDRNLRWQKVSDFVCFMMFMDEIIDTEEDVAILRDGPNRVIQKNLLGSNKEVAALFNTITREQTTVSTPYGREWAALREEIDQFVSDRPRVALLESIRFYFSKPWLVIGVAAAVLLLVLSFFQTLYTILGYYNNN